MVCSQGKATPKEMLKYIQSVPKESVVDVEGEVVAAPAPITATSQQVLFAFPWFCGFSAFPRFCWPCMFVGYPTRVM